MSILINPKIVINLDELLYGTVVQTTTGSTCSLHEALQTYCMNLMIFNHPHPGSVAPRYWKTRLYESLIAIPKLDIHTSKDDNTVKMDYLLELCIQYIFDRSTGRTLPYYWHMIAWDDVYYLWTRDFKVPSV